MILIVSTDDDLHARHVLRRLDEQGVAATLFDVSELPARAATSVRVGSDGLAATLTRADGEPVDLGGVRAVWFRRIGAMRATPELAEEDRRFAEGEATALLLGLGGALGDRFWVNPLGAAILNDRGNGKIAQLEVARAAGLPIPRTLVTNRPSEARSFVEGCPEGSIYKPFMTPTRNLAAPGEPPRYGVTYTTRVDEAALAKLEGVREAPCIFQELVPKRIELRVTVIGHRVFATEIHSQVDARSSLDFRRHYALGETPYAAHELPEPVARACREVCARLGLRFGAMDLILRPDGAYVFLEVNQQGQWLWLEQQTGQPLLDCFCAMLAEGREDYACDATAHEPGLPEL